MAVCWHESSSCPEHHLFHIFLTIPGLISDFVSNRDILRSNRFREEASMYREMTEVIQTTGRRRRYLVYAAMLALGLLLTFIGEYIGEHGGSRGAVSNVACSQQSSPCQKAP
jgi:hypothetical protein